MRLTRLGRFGTAIFAASMAFFGVQNLLVAIGMRRPNLMSPWTVTARGWSGVIAIVAIGMTMRDDGITAVISQRMRGQQVSQLVTTT